MEPPRTLEEALGRFEPVIGLEVHAQLLTRSKLFSPAPNRYDPEQPNRFVSAYCLGLPGVLPVLNESAVALAVRAGLALSCQIRTRSIFARKQYFYPDLPKGYQISQHEAPLCEGGYLDVSVAGTRRRIAIARIHMEEDAGKSTHADHGSMSLLDFNRAGVPLIEIVSEPDLRSAAEAGQYLRELRAILRRIEVCDGNMDEGSLRCDANVSLRPRGAINLGTRCEIKNLNSFRFVEQAIEHEILRQAQILSRGAVVAQETRLFDSTRRETRAMRSKEEAHDYRYFPDPDLPPLEISAEFIESVRAALPELPAARRLRWEALGVPAEHAQSFSEEEPIAELFDAALKQSCAQAVGIAQLLKGELLREVKEEPELLARLKLDPADLGELVRLREADTISATQQKKLFGALLRESLPLASLLERQGPQLDDESVLAPMIEALLAAHPGPAEKLRRGQDAVLGFFVGQVMKATGGKAKPALVQALVKRLVGPQDAPSES